MFEGFMESLAVETWALAICAYALGAAGSLLLGGNPRLARFASSVMGVMGGLIQASGAAAVMLDGSSVSWSLPSAVPLFEFSLRLDPLAAVFLLALGVVAAAVSLYSFGYTEHTQGRRPGVLGALLNLLLLSLTVVFTSSNAFLFLIAWEVMALTAYCLVSFEHSKEETRSAGILFFVMSHVGAGCLILAFLILHSSSGTFEFAGFRHPAGPVQRAALFGLFLIGFGVKAGLVPLHVWLPAAHPVAPSNVSALMSGIVVKTGVYGLLRVCFEFLGAPPLWAALLILILGVGSGLLGVLYALIENDLKRLLAYSTIENVGIVFIGIGASLVFSCLGKPELAAVALAAGLAHIVNHALFKSLLFLAAGSVLHGAGTRNMERMGGLLRRMPATAALFLIGAIAISGLPPLNGFVSEWLTYQSLLAGFGSTSSLTRLIFPVGGALLALTGALAATAFVKAFGISFLALPRSSDATEAHESHWTMLAGMSFLAVSCGIAAFCAGWLLPILARLASQLVHSPPRGSLSMAEGFVVSSGLPRGGTASPAGIAGLLALMALLAAVLAGIKWMFSIRRLAPAWDCGLPGLTAENEFTATAFSKPLRMIFAVLYQPKREIQRDFEVSPYFPKSIVFESEVEPTFERRLYSPLKQMLLERASGLRAIQAGSIHAYLAYIFVTLVLLLLFGVRS